TYWDASVGATYSSVFGYDTKYYIGAALFHFAQPKVAFDPSNDIRLNRKVVINAGLSASTGNYDRLILYVDYFTQGGNNVTQGGAIFRHDLVQQDEDESISLSLGAFYRWNDAFIPILKLDYYHLSMGLSYDVNISKLRTASSTIGGFELTLSYRGFLNIRNS